MRKKYEKKIEELEDQEKGGNDVKAFPHQIFRNMLPHIDLPMDNLYTKEEMKMVNETRKIMGDDSIQVTATTVRVPVFYGHSEAVNIETEKPIVDGVGQIQKWRRFTRFAMNQDTGGAIRGPGRADIFWGNEADNGDIFLW